MRWSVWRISGFTSIEVWTSEPCARENPIENRKITQGRHDHNAACQKCISDAGRPGSAKVEEIFIAQNLEKKYTKDQILEFYLNNIYYGNSYYGIGAAGRGC